MLLLALLLLLGLERRLPYELAYPLGGVLGYMTIINCILL
jgi:hypothetical protein